MRNARTYLLVAIGGVLFFTVFLLYVYNGAKGELAEAQKELDDYHKRFMRLTNELKDSVQRFAKAEADLRSERLSRAKDVSDKDAEIRKCSADIAEQSDTCRSEMDKLRNDLEAVKQESLRHKSNHHSAQLQLDEQRSECNRDKEAALSNYKELQDACDTRQHQLNVQKQLLESDLQTAQNSNQLNMENLQTCTSQLVESQQAADSCIKQLEAAKAASEEKQRMPRPASEERQHVLKKAPAPGAQVKVARQPLESRPSNQVLGNAAAAAVPGERRAFGENKVSDADKINMYKNLQERLLAGQTLSDQETRIFELLARQFDGELKQDKFGQLSRQQQHVPGLVYLQDPDKMDLQLSEQVGNDHEDEKEEVRDLVEERKDDIEGNEEEDEDLQEGGAQAFNPGEVNDRRQDEDGFQDEENDYRDNDEEGEEEDYQEPRDERLEVGDLGDQDPVHLRNGNGPDEPLPKPVGQERKQDFEGEFDKDNYGDDELDEKDEEEYARKMWEDDIKERNRQQQEQMKRLNLEQQQGQADHAEDMKRVWDEAAAKFAKREMR